MLSNVLSSSDSKLPNEEAVSSDIEFLPLILNTPGLLPPVSLNTPSVEEILPKLEE
jgi:hypothetical protein